MLVISALGVWDLEGLRQENGFKFQGSLGYTGRLFQPHPLEKIEAISALKNLVILGWVHTSRKLAKWFYCGCDLKLVYRLKGLGGEEQSELSRRSQE